MGMSASQARLLSLQARMSDVEYEGQQINQQRLVLSNKMNEVMEKMTNMDVPTPPSKQDFLYNKYSGKTKNGKKISAEMNDKGNFDVKKDVAGRIVEDAGLQNITSGTQMKGSEVSIPTVTGDSFHVCEGDEAADYRISDQGLKGKSPFTEYKPENYRKIYREDNPKDISVTAPNTYQGCSINQCGTENNCYADSDETYITIPEYEASVNYLAGEYEGDPKDGNATYYGTKVELSKTKYEVPGYGEVDADQVGNLVKTPEKRENGKVIPAEYYNTNDSAVKKVEYYKTYDKAGKPSQDKRFTNGNKPATNGYKTDYNLTYKTRQVKLSELTGGGKLEYADFEKMLDDYADKYSIASIMNGKLPVTGISEGAGEFSINNRDANNYPAFDVKNSSNYQYVYTKFIGVDNDTPYNFEDGYDYQMINNDGFRASQVKAGSDMIEHNNKVSSYKSKTFFYKISDNKYVSCNFDTAKSKAESGTEVFEAVDSGGQGITNKDPDFSVIKDNYYIMDGDNNALLIKEHGGADWLNWAIGQLKAGKKLFSKGSGDVVAYDKDLESDTTVNGCETMSVEEANGMDIYRNSTAFQDALTGLKQSFPDDWQQFSVIIDNSGSSQSFRFCRTNDLTSVDGQVRVYTPGQGTYQELISNVEPTYDENGYLEKLILPNGEVVDMEVEQAVDEIEYDKAMNKYNIAKIEYDKEVNELNKQTSIYQRQDKQLELKLTRLDTERNALNTEIDAVKKVIQDATEKGFKTFSG